MIPGEYQIQPGEIELNVGRRTLTLGVANSCLLYTSDAADE